MVGASEWWEGAPEEADMDAAREDAPDMDAARDMLWARIVTGLCPESVPLTAALAAADAMGKSAPLLPPA
jgi:hypothetical protein